MTFADTAARNYERLERTEAGKLGKYATTPEKTPNQKNMIKITDPPRKFRDTDYPPRKC